jgi:hypothetical protein
MLPMTEKAIRNRSNRALKFHFIYLLIIIGYAYIACSVKGEKPSQWEFESFLNVYQVLIYDSTNPSIDTKTRIAHFDSALRENNMNRVIFKQLLNYFRNNPKEFENALSQLEEILDDYTLTSK